MAIRRSVTVMSGSPRRRQILVVAVVGLAAALVLGLLLVGQTRAPAERAEREGTAWENVLSQIGPDGEVSFETALAAFSIAIGPLPGVQMPPGAATTVASGTGAIRWLSGYRSRLTDEQRAAVDRYLAPDPHAIRVEPGTASSGRVASVSTELVGLGAAAPAARTPQEEQCVRYLDDARGEIARLLRRPLLLPYTFAINDKQGDGRSRLHQPSLRRERGGHALGVRVPGEPHDVRQEAFVLIPVVSGDPLGCRLVLEASQGCNPSTSAHLPRGARRSHNRSAT